MTLPIMPIIEYAPRHFCTMPTLYMTKSLGVSRHLFEVGSFLAD
jgi:hypothetical protein